MSGFRVWLGYRIACFGVWLGELVAGPAGRDLYRAALAGEPDLEAVA